MDSVQMNPIVQQPMPVMPQQKQTRAGAKEEFVAFFYKELLKQSFSDSSGDLGIAKECFIEKMAKDMAKRNLESMPEIK